MLEKIRAFSDKQIAFDTYLPGTPHDPSSLDDMFPYHIWGRGNIPTSRGEQEKAAEAARQATAIRRRESPSSFEEACAYGNLQAAILMWSQGAVDISTRKAVYEGNDASALMWAAYKGHLPIVRFLVDQKANVNYTNSLGHTALQWCVIAGHADIARYLLDHGADASIRDRQGFDAGFAAAQNDRLAILIMLTEDAIKAGAVVPASSLAHAAESHNKGKNNNSIGSDAHVNVTSGGNLNGYAGRLVRARNNADLVNPLNGKPYYTLDPTLRDVEGHSLMHWSAYRNSPAACQYLVETWGYEVDVADQAKRTPLIWAAREGFSEVLELLLSQGADKDAHDVDGCTALYYAKARNHPEAMYVLTKYPSISSSCSGIGSTAGVAASSNRGGHGPVDAESNATMMKDRHDDDDHSGVRDPLLSGGSDSSIHINKMSDGATGNRMHTRYVAIRDQRAYGTIKMIMHNALFAGMALFGFLYTIFVTIATALIPPVFSYFPYGVFFFKNIIFTYFAGHPIQGGTGAAAAGAAAGEGNVARQLGIAVNLAESVRGTWRFRLRDPCNLVVVVCVLVIQIISWNRLGNTPFLFSFFSPEATVASNTGTFIENRAGGGEAYARVPVGGSSEFKDYWGGFLFAPFFSTTTSMVQCVLTSLFVLTLLNMVLCKVFSMRCALKRTEEGDLRSSPLWRILRHRQYRWLHPRFLLLERHTQIPVRTFYCPERDVLVRGYDSYSILLDCPIGASNHLFFVLALTFLAFFQWFLLAWGLQESRTRMMCPADPKWYADALRPLWSTEQLQAYVDSVAAAASATATMSSPLPGSSTAASSGVVSFAWLNTFMSVLLHGVPCRQEAYLASLTQTFLNSSRGLFHRVLYLYFYYVWPTTMNTCGVWVLHFGFIGFGMSFLLVLRQWYGVWYGVTQLELTNPLAPGSTGELVMVFPPDVAHATRLGFGTPEEERYYAAVNPEKLHKVPKSGTRSIFADGNGFVNCFMFLLRMNGRRWRDAMSVSSHNAPVRAPMLME